MQEVHTKGEWSLIFFDGEFSHAVLKTPKAGDFRVQEDFGGAQSGQKPPKHLVNQAKNVLNAVQANCVYARVDGIEIDEKLILMELELIEPTLFLQAHPKVPTRFAEAIIATLNSL